MKTHVRRMMCALETMGRIWRENAPDDFLESMDRIEVPLEDFVRIWPDMMAKDITINTFDMSVLLDVFHDKLREELAELEITEAVEQAA